MDIRQIFTLKEDSTIETEAKEAEFRRLFGELAESQQDTVLGMEREFALAAQAHSEGKYDRRETESGSETDEKELDHPLPEGIKIGVIR